MAANMFLKLEGIPGESTDAAHANEINILAFQRGSSMQAITSGSTTGKATHAELQISKLVDSSSALLLERVVTGKVIPNAQLTVRNPAIGLEFFKIIMQNAQITSQQVGGSDGENQLAENLTISAQKFRYEYSWKKPDGKISVNTYGWDIAANMKW